MQDPLSKYSTGCSGQKKLAQVSEKYPLSVLDRGLHLSHPLPAP